MKSTAGVAGVAMALTLLLSAAASVHAQDASDRADKTPTQAASTPAPAPRPFDELDQNADGAISKDEAAVDPPLAQAFGTLDKDADGRLSPDEYAIHVQGTP